MGFKRILNGFGTFFNFWIFDFLIFFENPVKILRDDPPTPPKASRTNPKIFDFFDFFDFFKSYGKNYVTNDLKINYFGPIFDYC